MLNDRKLLQIVQLNDRASADLPLYMEKLRDDQIVYNLNTPDLPWKKAVEITGGRRLVLTFTPDDPERDAYRQWKNTTLSSHNSASPAVMRGSIRAG